MDFNTIEKIDDKYVYNPYVPNGGTSIEFLNRHFGDYATADEMMNATSSEGLKNFFKWLKEEGILD